MRVRAKNVTGNPREPVGQIYNRLVYPGDVFEIPDEPVIHDALEDPLKPEGPENKKVRVISLTHRHKVTGAETEYTEYEKRKFLISRGAVRCSKADEKLFLSIMGYAPQWMEPAPAGSKLTINPQKSMPKDDAEEEFNPPPPAGTPNNPVAPAAVASPNTVAPATVAAPAETNGAIQDISNLQWKKALKIINEETNPAAVDQWLVIEKKQSVEHQRVHVIAALEAKQKALAPQP